MLGGNEAERVVDALAKLGEMGIQSVMLEGGPRLAGSFLDAGQIDEMRMFIAPIAVGGLIYSADEEGTTHVFAASPTFRTVAANKLDAGCMASPAVVDGAIFLRTKTHLYCIGSRE